MKKIKSVWITLVVIILPAMMVSLSFAHEGYFSTYSHHIEEGETALMLFSDYTVPSTHKQEEGQKNYFSQMLELKHNPTSQLALEFMLEGFEETGTGAKKFTGARYEARYRLFEQEVPLNPMVYVEYEDLDPKTRFKMEVSGWVNPPYEENDAEVSREKILETRLILSQDFHPWNIAFNWINESDFNSGETAFGYALGLNYRIRHKDTAGSCQAHLLRPMSLGFEFFGALGDTQKFAFRPSRQEHYFQPSIMFHAGKDSMLSLGFGIGLSDASDDITRFAYGRKF